MKNIVLIILIAFLLISFQTSAKKDKTKKSERFSFVFMTDIHVCPELHADEGLLQAVNKINELNPEFVITGGDNIMDALGQSFGRSDSLYNLYEAIASNLTMPIYHGLGNHEVFGLYKKSGITPDHKENGKKLFENILGKTYYSFDHKNWHFIVLDAIGFTEDRTYYGVIDSLQTAWLKQDLEKTGKSKPIVVSTHIPLLSVGAQIMEKPTAGFEESTIVTNANEIIPMLEQYNVKLVLQGHLHFLEDINYNGIHYITGGAVCSNWWKGPRFGMEEGFVKIDVSKENFTWEYIDYGWDVKD